MTEQGYCLEAERELAAPTALFDQMEEGVLCCDLDGRIGYANAAAFALLGLSSDSLTEHRFWDIEPPTTATALKRNFQRLLSSRTTQHFDLYFAERGRWLAGSLYRVGNQICCVARDISDEREASLRLRMLADASRVFDESGPGLEATFETIARTVAQILGDVCFVRFSVSGVSVFSTDAGAAPELAAMRPLAEILSQQVIDSGQTAYVSSNAAGTVEDAAPTYCTDRGVDGVPEAFLVVPVRLGDASIATLGVWRSRPEDYTEGEVELLRDLGERAGLAIAKAWLWEESRGAWKLAEQERARLDLALAATDTGIWDYDPETRELRWDDRCRELFGSTSLVGSHGGTRGVFEWIVEGDRKRVRETLDAALEPGADGQCSIEFRVQGPAHAQPRWLAAHGRVLFANGRPQRFLGTLHDITERKRIESARDQQVDELTRTVRISEMFVGVLGHDLRSPLSAINTTAGMLARRPPNDDVARAAQRILGSSKRMGRMVEQLLDFTRIRLGQGLPLERAPMDLSELVGAAVEELTAAEQDSMQVDVGGDCSGCWDRDRLWQLIANLGGNALQHRRPGTPVEVRLDGTRADWVVLEVRNAGAIAPELLPGLFEPMRMRRRNAGTQGLGLGLFISAQIARAHGGRIRVRSDDEAGTCFQVRLPRRG